jgi:gluconate 2-dehydrogenase gamma chain
MSEHVSRRDALVRMTLTSALAGVPAEAAQHAHQAVAAEKKDGPYKVKAFTAHEYRTLISLAELIMPGALNAGAPEFIDILSSANGELAAIFTGGLLWLDNQTRRRYGAPFVDTKPEQQVELLDLMAYRKNDSPELGPGIHFFDWARRMTVDAYFTSKSGVEALGYKGNVAQAQFEVPKEAIDHALKEK